MKIEVKSWTIIK